MLRARQPVVRPASTATQVWLNKAGVWVKVVVWVQVAAVWKTSVPKIKAGGVWK